MKEIENILNQLRSKVKTLCVLMSIILLYTRFKAHEVVIAILLTLIGKSFHH